MTDDMMMGERDLEAEVKEKDEIIMSLRLNEHLLKDKLEISRRNMSKQLERITALEKENIFLAKQRTYWKSKCAEWMGVKEENLSLRCVKISEKRYFKVEYDEEWYLFDSNTISEELVTEQAEYGYGVFANSLSPSEIEDLLNEMNEDIQYLNAFLVEQGLAEEYIRWKGDV